MNMPKNYGEAIKKGWIVYDYKLEAGYISRKSDINSLPIYQAQGYRKGEYYVLVPSWDSSRYCIREYIKAPVN